MKPRDRIKPKQKRSPACLGITRDDFILIDMGGKTGGGYIQKWRDKESGEEGWIVKGSKRRPEYIVEPLFILLAIDREIKWHKDFFDSSPGPSKDFRKGFIAGLRQAKLLIKELEKGSRGKPQWDWIGLTRRKSSRGIRIRGAG
jgi:hypothetical protein